MKTPSIGSATQNLDRDLILTLRSRFLRTDVDPGRMGLGGITELTEGLSPRTLFCGSS